MLYLYYILKYIYKNMKVEDYNFNTKTEDIDRGAVKIEILKIIDNRIFWKIVEKINWRTVMNERTEKTKERLYKAINQAERKAKIDKLENRKVERIDILELKEYYFKLLKLLKYYFEPLWLSDACSGPSDDGYWDLRSSIIGFGKEFLTESLNDDQLFIDMSQNHDYAENFGYIFN